MWQTANGILIASLQQCLAKTFILLELFIPLQPAIVTPGLLLEYHRVQFLGLSQLINVDGIKSANNNKVKNLGVIFDQDMSFKSHIKQVSRISFFHLKLEISYPGVTLKN
ncbi:hypothetical protein XENORESO_021565 [Xenotaenia resolanae]|uniref:Uncharacterized protein n=1 Tax=Xenotaenia resolanae TaxID=208358 RepID=A0ABV0W5Q8_9TELE